MQQSVSHYMMPGDNIPALQKVLTKLGLDGIENLVYGTTPPAPTGAEITVGCHLAYWPTWMNFYLGKENLVREDFPTDQAIIQTYGGLHVEDWLNRIRGNIRAALAAKPQYLVWHVADCQTSQIWTKQFRYSNRDVLAKTAEVYAQVACTVPDTVYVLFENIFWPGLNQLSPVDVEYFFSLLPNRNVGIMLDTGHLMNTNPDLITEADGAAFICKTVKELGSLASLIKGIHLSCSLSGAYQKSSPKAAPLHPTVEEINRHISSIDQHRPFQTDAAKKIVDTVQPLYLTHELFSHTAGIMGIPVSEVSIQKVALGER